MSYKPWYYGIAFVVIISLIFLIQMKKEPVLPVIGEIPSFHLVDQNDDKFTLQNMEGKVWLADFIFTTCAGPCPIMTERMKIVQKDSFSYIELFVDCWFDCALLPFWGRFIDRQIHLSCLVKTRNRWLQFLTASNITMSYQIEHIYMKNDQNEGNPRKNFINFKNYRYSSINCQNLCS